MTEMQTDTSLRSPPVQAHVSTASGTAAPFLIAQSRSVRLPAIDWMRGLVMVIMATDHASGAFNANKLLTDSASSYDPSQALDPLAFGFRWLSHLCAPTFLFLAGTSLALSIDRKRQRNVSSWSIDRDLLVRGLIILAIDLTFINYFWAPGALLLQVMYAIGVSMIFMIPLRRLPTAAVCTLALATLIGTEFFIRDDMPVPNQPGAIARALFFSTGWIDLPDAWGSFFGQNGAMDGIFAGYPALPWCAMMALGWVFGRYLLRAHDMSSRVRSPGRIMFVVGCLLLIVYAILRGLNEFGNLGLLRTDHSWVQWLHVSKYPPSLTYAALELGLMALILAAMFRWQDTPGHRTWSRNPILVFGQTAFFFYLAHIFVLQVAAHALDMHRKGGLKETSIACAAVLVVLYPVCLWYRGVKSRHPRSVLRYFVVPE